MKQATDIWRELHQGNRYFDTHSCYQGEKFLAPGGLEAVEKYLVVGKNIVILDLGCGYGRLMWHLLDLAGEVWGYDVAQEPLDRAADLLQQKGLNWRLFRGDGLTLLPVANASVDALVSVCVFQHLPRATAQSLAGDILRVLRPGGKAAIQFLCGPQCLKDVDLALPVEQSIQYSEAQIRELAAGAGLEVELVDHQEIGMGKLSYKWLVGRKA